MSLWLECFLLACWYLLFYAICHINWVYQGGFKRLRMRREEEKHRLCRLEWAAEQFYMGRSHKLDLELLLQEFIERDHLLYNKKEFYRAYYIKKLRGLRNQKEEVLL